MAQSQSADEELLDKIDALSTLDAEDTREFVQEALSEIRSKLEDNRETAKSMGHTGEPTVDEILDPERVDSIEVRARPFENPRVTVWLKRSSAVTWANDAWRTTFYPHGLNAYNSKVTTSFDVRPV